MPLRPPLTPSSSLADARAGSTLVVAERHEEAVHAVVDAAGDELGEDGRRLAVQRGVAEVVLPSPRGTACG